MIIMWNNSQRKFYLSNVFFYIIYNILSASNCCFDFINKLQRNKPPIIYQINGNICKNRLKTVGKNVNTVLTLRLWRYVSMRLEAYCLTLSNKFAAFEVFCAFSRMESLFFWICVRWIQLYDSFFVRATVWKRKISNVQCKWYQQKKQ